MQLHRFKKGIFCFLVLIFSVASLSAQQRLIKWSTKASGYYAIEKDEIVWNSLPDGAKKVVVGINQLIPAGQRDTLVVEWYSFSSDEKKFLIFTNSKKVWRLNTRGDYWIVNLTNESLEKLGASLPESSLMFAKLSPDNEKVAFVSEYNVYVENIATHVIKQLTTDGNRKFINGTFDWVYEEEFFCRDGIRWSPDSKSIAFWQLDARKTRDYLMMNFTDSVYSRAVPVEYPKVGESPSACRVGIIDISTATTNWINLSGDPSQHYIVRVEFIPGTQELLLQQLNRKQNETKLIRYNASTKLTSEIYAERDAAWVDVPASKNTYSIDFTHTFDWFNNGKDFLWLSEKDGWQHIYRISSDGKNQILLTKGDFDAMSIEGMNEKKGFVYFLASPENATQKYLYQTTLDGKSKPTLVTPGALAGSHYYNISPSGLYARHAFTNTHTNVVRETIMLPAHQPIDKKNSIESQLSKITEANTTEFFKVKTVDNVEMDGWMVKPENFDSTKKYPVVFYVYSGAASQTVLDQYGVSTNYLYEGDMRKDGYVYISVDNRGTPAPKGRAWRKSIYRQDGVLNIRDQGLAAKEILKWPFLDTARIAVWGWSGGGTATLDLLFQYPETFKTGIAIAAVTNMLTYDNIYTERYMGLPQENMEDYIKGSSITHAKNLRGNLLLIQGTGDDNVHYQNTEMLINELIRYNKQFQLMIYPNRTHDISEGEGTTEHLQRLFTEYLKKHCPPGPK
jgi:dipeptidyl-peptidase 4